MSNRRQEEEEHKSKDLHRLRNLRRFMLSPATPTYDSRSVISFFLFISSPRVSFHSLPSVCVPFCHVRCAPAHPLPHPAALPSFAPPPSSRTRAHISKTAVCQPFQLQVMRFKSYICNKLRVKCELHGTRIYMFLVFFTVEPVLVLTFLEKFSRLMCLKK